MSWTHRLGTLTMSAATAMTVLGLAAPANASSTTEPVSLGWHPAGPVHSSVRLDGTVYVGGKLDGTGGIAAIDAASGNLRWMIGTDGDVRALALSPDGSRLFAGGSFLNVDGQTHRHVAAINVADHSVVTTFNGKAAGQVRDLLVQGSTLYLAGRFTSVDGFAQMGLGAMDATTGGRDTTFAFAADADVYGLALAGNRLVVAGAFTQINGSARASLAAIDLSTNSLTTWAPARLCSICTRYWDVQTDGTNAYVAAHGNAAGAYNLVTGSQPWPRIKADGDIQAVWLPGNGRLYVGGHFGHPIWGGTENTNLVAAVFTSTGQADTSWTPKFYTSYPGVWALTSTVGRLWVGGDFTGEMQNGSNNHKPYLAAYPIG